MIPEPCEWGETVLMIFSENVGSLIYYTHVSALVIALFLGFYVLLRNPQDLRSRTLFVFSILFATWSYIDLILWASPSPEAVMFFWSLIVPIELLMYLSVLYIVYLFTHDGKDMPVLHKLGYSLTLIPIFLLAHTNFNVIGIAYDCEVGAHEGILIQYMYFVEIILIFVSLFYIIKSFKDNTDKFTRRKILLVGSAAILFLSIFTAGNLTLTLGMGPNYEQFKLFGMPVFATIVSYAIIKYNAFNIKAALVDILIAALWILLFSILLFQNIAYARPFILLSVVMFGLIGIVLSKSVRNEIKQKNEIAKLADNLKKANFKLKQLDKLKSEFVSVASHQLRSPLTAIRGYAEMLRDGSFGNIPQKMQEPLSRIEESSKTMATSIEDFLSVSRIESGNMKYDYSDFNLKEEAERIVDDLRPAATRKGLVLIFRSDVEKVGLVHADLGKTRQILHNLYNNALKYTSKGTVTVFVFDDWSKRKIYVDVFDTGIGMSTDTLSRIFGKFERAKQAHAINASGTGLGLYIAKTMTEEMGGTIYASSDGEGKGSHFRVELPLQM